MNSEIRKDGGEKEENQKDSWGIALKHCCCSWHKNEKDILHIMKTGGGLNYHAKQRRPGTTSLIL